MNGHRFSLAGTDLLAFGSGALYWPDQRLLCVSDLHLGKSERMARRGGSLLPPYETADTLARLDGDIQKTNATTIVCLGDSFDDRDAAEALDDSLSSWILRLQAGRRWVWIEGNHDPGPLTLAGTSLAELPLAPLVFRHIAKTGSSGEISGHYHPKVSVRLRGRQLSRPAFLFDSDRVVMPAYGTFTGGLGSDAPVLQSLMRAETQAILTGPTPHALPMPGSAS